MKSHKCTQLYFVLEGTVFQLASFIFMALRPGFLKVIYSEWVIMTPNRSIGRTNSILI